MKGFIKVMSGGKLTCVNVNAIAYIDEGGADETMLTRIKIMEERGLDTSSMTARERPIIWLNNGTGIRVAGESYKDILSKIEDAIDWPRNDKGNL